MVRYRRQTEIAKVPVVDIVQKRPVDKRKLGDFVCAANTLWAGDPDAGKREPNVGPPVARVSDVHNGLHLVDRATRKYFGGPGELTPTPRALRGQLEALKGGL
jgi:hypothetical protein